MVTCFVNSLSLVLLVVGNDSDRPGNKGLAELQGTWKLTSVEREGKSQDFTERQPRLVIQKDKAYYGGQVLAALTVDAAVSPKVIDLHFLSPERVYEAVYALDRDTLKICLNGQTDGVKERPGLFSTKDQAAWRLLSFERVKAAKEDAMEGLSGFVGVALRVSPDQPELLVSDVLKGSPAEKAGLKKDDAVPRISGREVMDLASGVGAVRQAKPGSDLIFRIRRGDKESDITVRVGVLPFGLLMQLAE